jgi:hypothetical protein
MTLQILATYSKVSICNSIEVPTEIWMHKETYHCNKFKYLYSKKDDMRTKTENSEYDT